MIELGDDYLITRTPFATEAAGEVKGEGRHVLSEHDLV